jgi:hypothetical protein
MPQVLWQVKKLEDPKPNRKNGPSGILMNGIKDYFRSQLRHVQMFRDDGPQDMVQSITNCSEWLVLRKESGMETRVVF